MSKTKHTPGPWIAAAIMHDAKLDICLVNPILPVDVTGWPVCLASVYFDSDREGVSQSEAEANARLMAAAPDLLHAATRALSVLKAEGYSGEEVICREIRAAIAKAVQGE